MHIKSKKQGGFTLVELVISIGIFALMTTLMLAKFGTFNQGILLSNLAYDVALTIRNAQSYGLNVKSANRLADKFLYPYGVHFDTSNPSTFIFFADQILDGKYITADDTVISTTNIKRNSKIESICVNTCTASPADFPTVIDITFKRPDPNAIITYTDPLDNTTKRTSSYAKITLTATDGSVKNVEVRSTGQIQVTN